MSHFQLFAYGTLRAGEKVAELLPGSERVGEGVVHGTLYDIEGSYTALMLYGTTPVRGVIWRCPAERLPALDEYEGLADGLFRRVAHEVPTLDGGARHPCWLYVAGPALSRKLTIERRILAPG